MPVLHLNYTAHYRPHLRCCYYFASHKKMSILLHLAWLNSKKLGFTLFLVHSHKDWTAALDRCLLSTIPIYSTAGLPKQKKAELVAKSQIAVRIYTHKTSITKHKIDIKTRQKHRYNTILIFRSTFFPRNCTVAQACTHGEALGGSAPLNFVAPRKICFKHIVKAKIVTPKNVLCPTKSWNLATGLLSPFVSYQ